MHRPLGGKRGGQHLLGAGLADAAGDRGDLRSAAQARGDADPAERCKHVVGDRQRPGDAAQRGEMVLVDDGGGGAGGKRKGDEIVAVMGIAADGEEGLARLDRAAVDGNAGDRLGRRSQRPAAGRAEEGIPGP